MENIDERSIFPQYIRLIKERGDKQKVKEGIVRCKAMLRKYPDDKPIIEAYLSLIKERGENVEEIKEAIEYAITWLRGRPEDNKIRLIFLGLVKDTGFFAEYIKLALNDAEEWMRKHGTHPLFGGYMKLVEKVVKTKINVDINFDLARQFCYDFINSSEGKKNIPPIVDFAELLWGKGMREEAEKIYKDLFEIQTNPLTMSTIYLSYGKGILGEAMNPELIYEECMEKLRNAEEKIREALKFHKGHYVAHMLLSIVLMEKGNKEGAKKELKEAEQWNRITKEVKKEKFSAGEIPFKIGNFYLEFNRYEEAANWLRIAIGKDPENFVNWWKLGYADMKQASILEEKGLFKEAKTLYEKAKSELETALEKAPKPLQLPASEEIPNLIEECKKHLQNEKI